MASYSYTYYSDTKNHGGWTATMQVSCGHYLTTTNDTVTINMEGAAQYSSNNATGYGVHVQVGHDAVSSPSYSKRKADGYGVLNYSNWVGSAKGSFAFTRTHSAYNVWIWSAAWGETVSGYGAAPESAGGGKTITIPARPSYSVSFNANGGSGAPAAQTKWYNESLTLSSTTPTRTGYTFNGWNTKSDGSGTNYAKGASYTGNAALTLYAKWTAVTYAISYNGNGSTSGSTSAQTKTYGVALTLRSNGYTRTNYVFKNWNTAANGSGTTYAAGASYTANAAATMYAQWYAPYTITPNPNGGTLASGCSALTKVYNTAKTIWASSLNPTRSGFNFKGWNTNASGTGTSYAAGASYTANANATLYAQWEIAHSNPTISNLLVQRCLQDGTLVDDGEYCKVSATVSVDHSTTGYTDTKLKTVTVQVGSNATESVTVSTTATSASISFISANQVSLTSAYSVKLTVTDSHDFSSYRTSNLSIAYFTMHFKAGGKGIAIGKKSVTDNLFDVNMNTKVTGTLDTTGKITASGAVQAKGNMIVGPSTTSNVVTFGSTNPKIEFQNTNSSQNGQLIFTDYDAVHPGATLAWITNQAQSWFHTQYVSAERIQPPKITSGISYITGNQGTAALYLSKSTGSIWYPAITLDTTSGGSWSIGNYDNENLQFSWASKANRDSSTNTTTVVNLPNTAGTIALTGNTVPKPTQLYNNATGVTGTVTLSQTAADFNYLRIFVRATNDSNQCGSVDVYSPNNKHVSLQATQPASNGVWIKSRLVKISAKSITNVSTANGEAGQSAQYNTDNTLYIYRVEGWK